MTVKIVPNDKGNPPGKLADALLRPIGDTTAQNRIRDLILQAYGEFETESALASAG